MKKIENLTKKLIAALENIPEAERVEQINFIRSQIHEASPFKNEPVDFVRWVINDVVVANDYNPNKVAPPEMQLLEVSILADGYTQPIVTFPNDEKQVIEVVDGFHRSRVGKESILVNSRVKGYLPVVSIRKEQHGKSERIASTIRHNRARGKHQVSAMSEIVIELKNRNWKNARIARELGMDEDEILRLCQISGLESLFTDKDFSKAWVSNDCVDSDNYEAFTGEVSEEDMASHRIPNENDPDRIFHPYENWEHLEYGFFDSHHPKLSKIQCEYKYKELLSNSSAFGNTLNEIFQKWPNACEHNLTNKSMNRIAWMGQAAVSYKYNVPAIFSSGWQMLDEQEQEEANQIALEYLNSWLKKKGLQEVTMEEALLPDRQVELY